MLNCPKLHPTFCDFKLPQINIIGNSRIIYYHFIYNLKNLIDSMNLVIYLDNNNYSNIL